MTTLKPLPHVDTFDLYNLFTKEVLREQKKRVKEPILDAKDSSLSMSIGEPTDPMRPIPDGEFEISPLGYNPSKGVKISVDLPDLAKRQLKAS